MRALAWTLVAVMVVCFLGALAAVWYARRTPPWRRAGRREPAREGNGGLRAILDDEPAPEEEGEEDEILARFAHPDPFVRVDAIDALKDRPDGEPMIVEALRDEYPVVRRQAVRALQELGTASAARALIEVARHDPSAEVREEAVEALGAIVRERQNGIS